MSQILQAKQIYCSEWHAEIQVQEMSGELFTKQW